MSGLAHDLEALLALEGCARFSWEAQEGQTPDTVRQAVRGQTPVFIEWDPDRGLVYFEFEPPAGPPVTRDLSQLHLEAPSYRDIFRFEWNLAGALVGLELQTRAPGPLPCLRLYTDLLPDGQKHLAERSLTANDWQNYLKTFRD